MMVGVEYVMELTHTKECKAYQIIRTLNAELKAKGYLIIRARVPKKYLHERLGIAESEGI